MSYFPNQIMPKLLMKETSKEVDMSPAIANAKDWNIIHKEIRAVEQLLIGTKNPKSLVIAGANQTGTTQLPKSLSEAVSYVTFLTNELFNGCWMNQFNGTIQTGNFITLPDCVVKTKTVGDITAADTTITVESTKGFPSSGTITKFNGLRTGTYCESGSGSSDVGGGDLCAVGTKYLSYSDFEPAIHRTSQEIITYTSKTETQFLGCSRAEHGSTAEDLSGAKAVIVSGNASLFVSHNFWAEQDNPENHASEVYLSITPELYINGGVLRRGTNQTINSVKKYFEASYALTIVSDFQDVNFSQVCGVNTTGKAGGLPDVPDEPPPIILKSGFFRLDNMTLYEVGWHHCWEVTGIVVLPIAEIQNTSKTVRYLQNTPWGNRWAVLPRFSSNSTIPLIYNEVTPTYARFWNQDRNWNWAVGCPYSANYCGLFHGIELSFRNYRTYGALTVADVRLTAAGSCYGWLNLFSNIWPNFARNPRITSTVYVASGTTNLSASSSFTFSTNPWHYYWLFRYRPVQLQTRSNSVSYIVPNSSFVGWEKYFNI